MRNPFRPQRESEQPGNDLAAAQAAYDAAQLPPFLSRVTMGPTAADYPGVLDLDGVRTLLRDNLPGQDLARMTSVVPSAGWLFRACINPGEGMNGKLVRYSDSALEVEQAMSIGTGVDYVPARLVRRNKTNVSVEFIYEGLSLPLDGAQPAPHDRHDSAPRGTSVRGDYSIYDLGDNGCLSVEIMANRLIGGVSATTTQPEAFPGATDFRVARISDNWAHIQRAAIYVGWAAGMTVASSDVMIGRLESLVGPTA